MERIKIEIDGKKIWDANAAERRREELDNKVKKSFLESMQRRGVGAEVKTTEQATEMRPPVVD